MTKKINSKYVLATGDCETDPFEFGVIPQPFVWGFFSEAEGYNSFWGGDGTRDEQQRESTLAFIEFLNGLDKPHLIYMHNGGKFDFLFLLSFATGRLKIVNGRILEMHIGEHVLRDSYAAVPIPLAAYKKDDIDYTHLAFDARQKNKSEILHYLGGDVRYLFEMMQSFREEFGNVLTIGTAAMRALKTHHSFDEFTKDQDGIFRQFYYGGRCQCFDSGILRGKWKVYDANSMYPYCMSSMLHPVSATYSESATLTDNTDFVIVEGRNFGGLPFKHPKGFLDFATPRGTFYVTGHELRAAIDTGTFEIERIVRAYTFAQRTSFGSFVDHWYGKRIAARAAGLDLYVLFYKLILNSSYGKFCLNSDNFKDWEITNAGDYLDDGIWSVEYESDEFILWSKPSQQAKYYNVATGASITGGARSVLLRGLSRASRPVYCDTDSIICESLEVDIDDKKLGAWKLEAEGNEICIAGKKLYALYNNGTVFMDDKGKPKQASKGARLSAEQIRNVALGGTELFQNPVPSFKLDGKHEFVKRQISKTVCEPKPFGE